MVYTAMQVEHTLARPEEFLVVPKSAYAELAAKLGVKGDGNNSTNSLRNVLEFLTWVAFEESRFWWIVALAGQLACKHGCDRARNDSRTATAGCSERSPCGNRWTKAVALQLG